MLVEKEKRRLAESVGGGDRSKRNYAHGGIIAVVEKGI